MWNLYKKQSKQIDVLLNCTDVKLHVVLCCYVPGATLCVQWEVPAGNQDGYPSGRTCLLLWLHPLRRWRDLEHNRSRVNHYEHCSLLVCVFVPVSGRGMIYLRFLEVMGIEHENTQLCSYAIKSHFYLEDYNSIITKIKCQIWASVFIL